MKGKWHFVVLCALFATWSKAHDLLWLSSIIFLIVIIWLLKRRASFLFLFFLATTFFLIMINTTTNSLLANPTFFNQEKQYEGKIISNPEKTDKSLKFVLRESHTKEKVLITIPLDEIKKSDMEVFQYGATCELRGKLSLPSSSRNPGSFDYQKYLAAEGIYVQLFSLPSNVICEGQGLLAIPYELRDKLLLRMEMNYSEEAFSWIQALIFGEKDFLSDQIISEFQQWNLSHILAISGLHVGLIVGFLYFLLTRGIGLTKDRAKIILMLFLPIYTLFAGSAPPVLRAAVMTEIFFFASFIQKKWPITDVISITAVVFILNDPNILDQLSFQFSFLVTYAILLSKKIILNSKSNVYVWTSIFISLISQLTLIPLQLQTFYYISPLSLFSNLLFVPYFSIIIIPLSLLGSIFWWVPILQPVIDFLLRLHNSFLLPILDMMGNLDFLWVIGKITIITFILYYILLYLFLKNWEGQKYRTSFQIGVLLVLLLVIEQLVVYLNPYGTVTMLDVGQGDTIIIELPHRSEVIMIDAAKKANFLEQETNDDKNDIAHYTIQPFLWSKGIKQIDHLIITHEDIDHAGSLPYLLDNFEVKSVYVHPSFQMDLGENNNVQPHVLTEGSALKFDDYPFYVLNPISKSMDKRENNMSIVLYSKLGGKAFLFTGDVHSDVEERLIKDYPNLQVDVLKVAHHGSKNSTSSDFLNKIQPEIALISVGQHNMYGHPAPQTIERLGEHNMKIYRTDQNGAIIFKFRAGVGTFLTWIP